MGEQDDLYPGRPGEQGDPAAGGQVGQQGDQEMVPVSVVQSIREELNTLKEQNQVLNDQINLYRANAPGAVQQGEGQEERREQKGDDLLSGMEDDEVLTVADMKRILDAERRKFGQGVGEVTMSLQHSDYQDVIGKHLPKVLQTNPALIKAIRTSETPHILAYELGKTNPEYVKAKAEAEQNEEAKRIEANAGKPGSASQAAGGAGGLSGADYYAQLSDDDLEKRIDEVKNRG